MSETTDATDATNATLAADSGASRAALERALALARDLLAGDAGPRAEAERETRARFLVFAALRRVAPQARCAAQAVALGFPETRMWTIASYSSAFRTRGRASRRGHWHAPEREDRIVAALSDLPACGAGRCCAPEPAAQIPVSIRIVPADARPARPLGTRHVPAPIRRRRVVVDIAGTPPRDRSALHLREQRT